MNQPVKIKNALISVYYKDNLEPIIHLLQKHGVKIFSTGGTEKFIRDLGVDVTAVEDLTGYPSILGGRVKTLHPSVFGGILSRRDNNSDKEQTQQFEIPEIDLVIVDLYPFEETIKSGASEEDIIEKIDIGGISLIRAGAKNFKDVVILSSRDDYKEFENILAASEGFTSLEQRKYFAKRAFHISSHYDTSIFTYFNNNQPEPLNVFKQSETQSKSLRYGENPHQAATFYGDLNAMFDKLNGKELSYNNLVDVDAAVSLIDEFYEPTFAILKHTNACGIASNDSILEAWKTALACDPVSAFGGVLISNVKVDEETAEEISHLFFEVLIAPEYSDEAIQILTSKKNRIILRRKEIELPALQFKTLLNGIIQQDKDTAIESIEQMECVTDRKPETRELTDLVFANKIVKHTKSNTIVLVKDGKLISSGVGQTSRVDALI